MSHLQPSPRQASHSRRHFFYPFITTSLQQQQQQQQPDLCLNNRPGEKRSVLRDSRVRGLRASRSALDAPIVFERPPIAHSSLPIYGSDTHLRACSKSKKKKILTAHLHISGEGGKTRTYTPHSTAQIFFFLSRSYLWCGSGMKTSAAV